MKITLEKIEEGEEELIVRYREMDTRLEAILHLAQGQGEKLSGIREGLEGQIFLLSPEDIYYFESVDGMVYAYLQDSVYRIQEGLNDLLNRYESRGFFRCSRTMLVNIYRITYLKSETEGRILATLNNGEKIMISRKYAILLRSLLKRGRGKKG